MTKLREWFDVVWPCLERQSEKQREVQRERDESDLVRIGTSKWKSPKVVLEECRALAMREESRARSADARATIYLGVLAAIVPLAAATVRDFSSILETWSDWIIISLTIGFLLGMLYLTAAGIWVFQTLKVRAYGRVDVDEIIGIAVHRDEEIALCREILRNVRRSRSTVNRKITCMKMAHLFLVRMFVVFVILVMSMGIVVIVPLFVNLTDVTLCLVEEIVNWIGKFSEEIDS